MRRIRPAAAAALLALLSILLSCGITYWQHEQTAADNSRELRLRTELLLRSAYELHGDWEWALAALADTPLVRATQLRVWTAEGEPVSVMETSAEVGPETTAGERATVYERAAVEPMATGESMTADEAVTMAAGEEPRRYPLLSQGRIVGSYTGSFDAHAPLPWSWLLLGMVPGLIVGLAAYALLRRQELRQQRQLGSITAALETAGTSGAVDRNPDQLAAQLLLSAEALRRRLEQLETVRKTMVADIAHELRTPLTVMRARLDRALQQQDALEPAELATLQDEVYRMSKLLHDLQQLALAESGHLKLDKQWFPVRDLLEEMTELMRLEAESSGIEVVSRIEAPALLYADEHRIKQVLLNLIGNALRHARSRVTLEAVCTEQTCTISIVDDGIGIEQEELPHLFDRFYRGIAGRRAAGAGLGLGLAIAKQLTETHHGTLEVDTRWQEGTTFRLQLPIIRAD